MLGLWISIPWNLREKLDLETNFLLSVLEVCDVFDVLLLSWVVPGFLQSLERVQAELIAVLGNETVFSWNIVTLYEFFVDRLTSDASIRFSQQIFGFNIWDVTLVSRNMLCFDVVCWSSDPICSNSRVVSNWQFRLLQVH